MNPALGSMLLLGSRNGFRSLAQLYRAQFIYGNIEKMLAAGVPEVPGLMRNLAKMVSLPLAQTGEGISECELVAWAIKPGDMVSPFDKLCDVQSDKAAIEITSRYGGRVLALHHAIGAMVKVGAPLVDIEVADDVQVAPEHLAAPATSSSTTGDPGAVPGALLASATAAAAATVGAQVAAASTPMAAAAAALPLPREDVAEPPSPSPSPSLSDSGSGGRFRAQSSPAVRSFARENGVNISQVRGTGPGGRITRADVEQYMERQQQQQYPHLASRLQEGAPTKAAAATVGAEEEEEEEEGGTVLQASDFLGGVPRKSVVREGGAAAGSNSGLRRRSVEELLLQYNRLVAAAAAASGSGATSKSVPLRGYRRAMVASMTTAASIPVFHLHDEVVMDRMLAAREVMRNDPGLVLPSSSGVSGGGVVRLTVLPLIIKALSAALKLHPRMNASLAPGGAELLLHPHHNIGIAMATNSGLVVPNIKQVERKSVAQVAAELLLLQQLAAAGRLPAETLTEGTITISNIGTIGGTFATPLVTPPSVAIVALGRLQLLPRYYTAPGVGSGHYRGGGPLIGGAQQQQPQAVPVPILPVSWGADHRVVDGATLAAFNNSWKELLEQPEKMLLHLA